MVRVIFLHFFAFFIHFDKLIWRPPGPLCPLPPPHYGIMAYYCWDSTAWWQITQRLTAAKSNLCWQSYLATGWPHVAANWHWLGRTWLPGAKSWGNIFASAWGRLRCGFAAFNTASSWFFNLFKSDTSSCSSIRIICAPPFFCWQNVYICNHAQIAAGILLLVKLVEGQLL